jgi:WGR domain.
MITMKPVRLVNTTEGHRKFWAVEVVGRKALCSWGRIGTWIQSKEFQFDSAMRQSTSPARRRSPSSARDTAGRRR